MDEYKIRRMDEIVLLRRRINALGFTIKEMCEKCHISPATFSNWAAGKGRTTKNWDEVCRWVRRKEIIKGTYEKTASPHAAPERG